LILEESVDSLVKVPFALSCCQDHCFDPYLVAKEPPSAPFDHPLQPKAGSLHTQISGVVKFQWSFFARWTRDHKSDRAISHLSDLPILKRNRMRMLCCASNTIFRTETGLCASPSLPV
jgi:hypothetical protein